MKYWLCLFLVWISWSGRAQELAWFNITQQQGLPSNTVYNILQARNGFLWVATENGLARYNGYSFRTYENPAVRSQAFSGLLEDNSGRIWLHNFFGEILYVENDTLKKLESWEKYYQDGFPTLTHFNDTLLISTPWHAYLYSTQSKKWQCIDSLFAEGGETSLLRFGDRTIDGKGNIWICYTNQSGTYLKNMRQGTTVSISEKTAQFNTLASKLVPLKNKVLVFDIVLHSFLELNNNSLSLSNRFDDQLQQIRQISTQGDSLLFFLNPNGLHLSTDSGLQTLLPEKNVSSMVIDREGGYWVGTLNEGIFYIPNLYSKLFPKERWTLFTKIIADKRRGLLIAGGYDGSITVFNNDGALIKHVKPLKNREVQSLFADAINNRLLVYTDRLYTYSLKDFSFIGELAAFPVKRMIIAENQYAMATSGGLNLLDFAMKNLTILLPQQRMTAVGYDPSSRTLWIGAQKGLYRHNLADHKTTLWKDTEGNSPGVSRFLNVNGRVILGTLTNGIYFLKDGRVEKKITVADGLPSNRISSLVEREGFLWGGTEKGIFSLDLSTNEISVFDHSKGLAALEIYDLTFVDNQLWVSHPNGLQRFTSLPTKNNQPCIVHIERASSDGVPISIDQEGITLQPSSHQLTFQFNVSNNLKSRGATRIRYRIKELDHENWHQASLALPIANYLALPSGNLTFEVMAVNEDNISSRNVISIPIHVLAPFWKRSWFLITVTAIVLAIIAVTTYWRFKRLNARHQRELIQQHQEQQLRIAQLTSIRAQMNPHFIFNTLSSIQGKILNGQIQEANESIQNFAQLLRRVLEVSSNEMVLLQEEVNILMKYLTIEKDRFDGSLDYEIIVDKALRDELVQIPSLLTQPFVENALRHGLMHKQGVKKLKVEFLLEDHKLLIRIDDNGIGRKAAEEFNKARHRNHQSFALGAYQKRIELLNEAHDRKIELNIIDKYNENGMAQGTAVTITLPLSYEPA